MKTSENRIQNNVKLASEYARQTARALLKHAREENPKMKSFGFIPFLTKNERGYDVHKCVYEKRRGVSLTKTLTDTLVKYVVDDGGANEFIVDYEMMKAIGVAMAQATLYTSSRMGYI